MSLSKLNSEIIRLKVAELSPEEIAKQLDADIFHVYKILERDKTRASSNPKYKAMLDEYEDGYTLEEIGQKYKVTRERVRQCIEKEVGFQLGYGPQEQKFRRFELKTAVRAVVQISRDDRVGDVVEEKLKEAELKGIEPKYFDSIRKYCAAVGVKADALKINRPDIYNIVKINQNHAKQKWNTYYDACRMCGLTEAKYRSNGYCENCYAKSPEWKQMVKLSYQRNKETRQLANKKFREKYIARPEIAAKLEQEYDLKYFGGNRSLALERDNHKCLGCGMSTEVKDKLGRQKVRVWHLNGSENHSLDNLGTYCQSCLYKLGLGPRRDGFGEGRKKK